MQYIVVIVIIAIICCPVYDAINFDYPSYQAIFLHNQKTRQKTKYLQDKRSLKNEIKIIFHHFKQELSVFKTQEWTFNISDLNLLSLDSLVLVIPCCVL